MDAGFILPRRVEIEAQQSNATRRQHQHSYRRRIDSSDSEETEGIEKHSVVPK